MYDSTKNKTFNHISLLTYLKKHTAEISLGLHGTAYTCITMPVNYLNVSNKVETDVLIIHTKLVTETAPECILCS